MTIYSIKDGNYGLGSGAIEGGTDFEGTLEDAIAEAFDSRTLEQKKEQACNLVNTNYTTYCLTGLSYTDGIEYIIDNTHKTRDEVDKKYQNVDKNIDMDYDWTMDEPRVKITFFDKNACKDFLKSVQEVIADNETLLRDLKTAIENYDQAQVGTFINTPTYPAYGRTV
jgi:hypothetical protein